ncbi:MAG TPA: tyrosine-type recombinase/integrase [Rhodoferax sp.]
MNTTVGLRMRVQEFLREQRNLGYHLVSCGRELLNFASFVEASKHHGAVTVELTSQWAREAHGGNVSPETSARRLVNLRPFLRWLQQFDAATEVPDDSIFGSLPGRKTPHIYRADEVVALMQEAGKLGPADGLRAATFATLFGLIYATGLRIGEALGLADMDVDLVAGVLTVRSAKFGKSRLVPVHPSVIAPLATYRATRLKQVPNVAHSLFFVGSRGVHRGKTLGDRQVHRIFTQLRTQLGWIDRGGHGQPRIHDLRHSFAVKRLTLWHEQDVDLNQRMLALSTYMGHAKISHTYWYLTGVPELMALAGARFECFACAGEFDHE